MSCALHWRHGFFLTLYNLLRVWKNLIKMKFTQKLWKEKYEHQLSYMKSFCLFVSFLEEKPGLEE